MGYGKGFRLIMLIFAFMIGFLGTTAILGGDVGSFVGGLEETAPESNEGEGTIEDDSNCVIATDEDFSGTVNGKFRYIGSDGCVEIPHVIKGVEVTSYRAMFRDTKVSKVVSDNPNIRDMSYMLFNSQATELDLSSFDTSNVKLMREMFVGSKATELDLSSFDTSNVTDMSYMFLGSPVTELDLSSFDTSNVTRMAFMFSASQATVLDLSSFDTSNVTDMEDMFEGSQAKTVYARTQVDADKFNEPGNIPIGLQVIVKQ